MTDRVELSEWLYRVAGGGQMPPTDHKLPSGTSIRQPRKWANSTLDFLARHPQDERAWAAVESAYAARIHERPAPSAAVPAEPVQGTPTAPDPEKAGTGDSGDSDAIPQIPPAEGCEVVCKVCGLVWRTQFEQAAANPNAAHRCDGCTAKARDEALGWRTREPAQRSIVEIEAHRKTYGRYGVAGYDPGSSHD